MKKWFLFLITVLILCQLPIPCFAWVPSTQFFCQVDSANIPENAVFAGALPFIAGHFRGF